MHIFSQNHITFPLRAKYQCLQIAHSSMLGMYKVMLPHFFLGLLELLLTKQG